MNLSELIKTFIETLPAERRLFPELYADDLAKAIEAYYFDQSNHG